eukprot:2148574-Amphidinium_carterae.1
MQWLQDLEALGATLERYQVRPHMTTLLWCSTCGAYAENSLSSLGRPCPGQRKPGAAASNGRTQTTCPSNQSSSMVPTW